MLLECDYTLFYEKEAIEIDDRVWLSVQMRSHDSDICICADILLSRRCWIVVLLIDLRDLADLVY